MKWILASSSPRRKQLFEKIDLDFIVVAPNVDESFDLGVMSPTEYCCYLADQKSKNVSHNYPDSMVIGADTIVIIDNKILGKPKNKSEAISMLYDLSGHTHTVMTAVSIRCSGTGFKHTFFETTDVQFKKLSEKEIKYYIDRDAPYDKAGSYGIQDFSGIFVKSIRGCYQNVVGFPIARFCIELQKKGIISPWEN
ncbi:MAG: Maf family protein [Fidelibacterota bacterium]